MGLAAAAMLGLVRGAASATFAPHNEGISMASNESAAAASTMDNATKAHAFREVLRLMAAGEKVDPALWDDFVTAQNDAFKTGPAVGEKVPDFTLPDQNGKDWPLRELMGPKGLLLAFVRSADW
jgi:hypothetical protein